MFGHRRSRYPIPYFQGGGPTQEQLDAFNAVYQGDNPFDYTGAFQNNWSNAIMPFIGGQFSQLFEGQQGYNNFQSRQGDDKLNAQPGFFGFQRGGPVSDRARQGYSDGSPYRNSPSINIPGNNITMANTSTPLMLVPNQGRPTMAPPRSGSYYFPGASSVQEIPMRQMGGMANFFNDPQAMAQAQQVSRSQEVDTVLRPKGDPWEYRKSASGYQTRKKGSDKWITVTEKTNNGAALANIAALYTGKPMPFKVTASGKAILNSPAKAIEATKSVNISNPKTNLGSAGISNTWDNQGHYGTPMEHELANAVGMPGIPRTARGAYSAGINKDGIPLGLDFPNAPTGYQLPSGLQTYASGMAALPPPKRYNMTGPFSPLDNLPGLGKYPANRIGAYNDIRSYQMGGQVEDNEPIEVQTEQGEVIAFQDGTLVPVKAKKSHKKMDKDEVTDVLPKGTYIFSKDKRMTFRPEQRIGGIVLEDLVIGKSVVQYSETEPTPAPEELTLGKILTKKMTSADMANKVRVMFPVTDREKDPFARWANDENKQSRLPYLEALVAISETKRPKKVEKFQYGGVTKLYDDKTLYGMAAMDNVMKRDNQLVKSTMLPSALSSTSHSMGLGSSKFFPRTFRRGGVPKAQTGLDIFSQLLGPVVDLGFGIFDRVKGAGYFKDTMRDINTNQDTTTGYLNQARNIGQAGNILNYGTQDTGYDFLNLDSSMSSAGNAYDQVARGIQADSSTAQQLPLGQANSFARYASGSGMSPTQIGNYAGQIATQGIGQSNQAGLQYNNMRNANILGRDSTMRGYQDTLAHDRQTGRNYTRGANNQINANLIQGMVGTENNRLQGMSDLNMQTLAAKMGARGQQMNFMTNNGLRIGDAATNLGNGIYNAVRPPYDPYGTDMRYGTGHAGGYSTGNYGNPYISDPYQFGSAYGQFGPPPNYPAPPGYSVGRNDPWAFPFGWPN